MSATPPIKRAALPLGKSWRPFATAQLLQLWRISTGIRAVPSSVNFKLMNFLSVDGESIPGGMAPFLP